MQPQNSRQGDEIAIVGMASLFTGAPDLETFWHNILQKVEGTRQPSPDWHPERYLDPTGTSSERLYTTAGGFLGEDYRFDPLEFGIMPGSVDGQEPDQFIALRIARDALADAGYLERPFDRSKTGVILGHSTYLNRAQANAVQFGAVLDQTLELLEGLFPGLAPEAKGRIRDLLKGKLAPFNADTGPGLVPNVMTGRIANRLDLGGPNYLIDAACASSLLAIQSAVEELRSGRSDMMLAGGVNASTPAEAFLVFCQLGALSRQSRIRPFDSDADGTLLGEGAGVVVLKRQADAIRDGDRIYALIRGIGQSSDGRGAGLLAPRLEGEVLAMRRGYQEAGVEPQSVTLLEAHGTGIPLGDQTEIEALRTVFGERSEGAFPRCAIGSVKSMICHCIPAAGVAGVIKSALALHYRVLPPTLCENVNPKLGLDRTPFYVNTETRPWVHPRAEPRRAAVSSFGFGGINAHCVMEETTAPDADMEPRLPHWPHELILLTAEDRAALLVEISSLGAYLAEADLARVSLADIAYTLSTAAHDGAERLAIVAKDLPDLATKLERAGQLLADPDKHRIQTRTGTFFSDQALDGRLAFLFPGEGAQYPGMLADLALYFPVVRAWFDLWDAIFHGSRSFAPSSILFPAPTGLDESLKDRAEALLFGLEAGSESMFIASQALQDLLSRLGLRPDAVVGHSSGENTALVVAGALDLGGARELRDHIMRLNRMYQDIEAAGQVATGKLLTVGAVERTRIIELVAESEGHLHLALDNCRHQAVLFGAPEDIESAANVLRGEGGLCSWLPFDRAYHTPLFAPVARLVDHFYEQVSFQEPHTPIYSCVTCGPFPKKPKAIRALTVQQWQSCVRFTETVEQLHADGFRYLVEVGPSSNLTNFIDDILRGKDYVAASVDNRNRSGLMQLLQLLGRLFVHGRKPDLTHLFSGRQCRRVDFAAPAPSSPSLPTIKNTLPYIRLDPEQMAEIRGLLFGERGGPALERQTDGELAAPHPAASTAAHPDLTGETDDTGLHERKSDMDDRSDAQPDAQFVADAGPGGAGADAVISDYLHTMREFLHNQQQVMTAAFTQPGMGASRPNERKEWNLPLIHRVTRQTAEAVETETDFDLTQAFVLQHTLYADQVSDQDARLTALPVVPMTVSLELLAETASLLAGGLPLTAMERVHAFNWVALDRGAKSVRTVAERVGDTDHGTRIRATLLDGEQPLLSAEILFSTGSAEAAPALPALARPKPSTWTDQDLYSRGMFHGPLFHSVKSLHAWDETGLDAELAATPTNAFFGDGTPPRFLLNPVLLDAVGHITAFWVAQQQGTDFSSFPSSIERIRFFRGDAEDTDAAMLRGRLGFVAQPNSEARFLQGDYACHDAAGRPLFQIQGWRDRFFSVPHRFYLARTTPREAWLGTDATDLLPGGVPAETLVWQMDCFDRVFLNDAGGVWRRLLAHTYLSADEREQWHGMAGPPGRLNDWLNARLVLKEAVRYWLWQRTDVLLFPADIVVASDSAGRPLIARHGLETMVGTPDVSVSHSGTTAVAAVTGPTARVGIDLETLGHARMADVIETAYTPSERKLLDRTGPERHDQLALLLWCAKEAAGKALGIGLGPGPQHFEVRELNSDWSAAFVAHQQWLLPVSIVATERSILALTFIELYHTAR